MKKLKANVILTSVVLIVTLMFAGAFMIDAANVIMSRYQLQKATEGFALEYTSSLSKAIEDRTMHTGGDFQRDELQSPYEKVYNSELSGITNFQPKEVDYFIHSDITPFNADYKKDAGVIRIRAESDVYPAFLRIIGTKDIKLHATAYTKMERIDGATGIPRSTKAITKQTMPSIENGGYVDFNFGGDIILTNKPRGKGDFAIEYGNGAGGFFIFGGYKGDLNNPNDLMWVDLGDDAIYMAQDDGFGGITKENIEKNVVNVNGKNYTCVSSNNYSPIVFSLNNDNFTKKLSRIKIYRAKGKDNNPCEPCTQEDPNCGDESKIDKKISLIILNHVSLITKKEFESFNVCSSSGCSEGHATFTVRGR